MFQKNIYTLLICFLLFSQMVVSQKAQRPVGESLQSNSLGDAMYTLNSRGSWLPIKNSELVEGSPLAFEIGNNKLVIFTSDGNMYKLSNGNYNAQIDELVSVISKDSIFVFDSRNFDYVMLNNQKMKRFDSGESKKKRFYKVLGEDDDKVILKKISVKIKPGAINRLTQEKISNDKYYLYEDLYISESGEVRKLKLNKKLLSTLFSDKESEIQTYIKSNKLSIKKEEDFLKIFEYYAEL